MSLPESRAAVKARAKTFIRENYALNVGYALLISAALGKYTTYTVRYQTEQSGALSDPVHLDPGSFDWSGIASALSVTAAVLTVLATVFLLSPAEVDGRDYFLKKIRGQTKTGSVAFGPYYMNIVKTMFLRYLYIFLWSLLFVIPGLIAAYRYAFVPYILAEHPDMDAREVLQKSKEMTDGRKMDLFILSMSFLLWEFASSLVWGLLDIFYVNPYIYLTWSIVYDELSVPEEKETIYVEPEVI